MRLHSLQGLRAVCITLVVLSHVSGTQHFPRVHMLEIYGNLGVRIFLVVSGYLITAQLVREYERSGRISLKMFYVRRAFRIFPAAYVFMFVAAATHWSVLRAGNIATALAYCVNYYQNGHHVLGHLWSLGVEEQYYLLWPLTLLLFFRKRLWIVAAAIAAGPPLRVIFYLTWGRPGLDHPFPVFMDALAMGAAVSMLEPWPARWQRIFVSRWFAVVPAATAGLPLIQLWNTRVYQTLGLTALHLGIALSLKHVMMRRYAALNVGPVEWLGAISYSLYLWQQIFLDRGSPSFWTAFPQNLVLSIVLATASYHGIEKPFLKIRERWTKAKRPHLVGTSGQPHEQSLLPRPIGEVAGG
ncbi:MAG TPA: acyltransferase [Terriglobales bacterium]|nr:acyltransferase [Terriglobales bacterium]